MHVRARHQRTNGDAHANACSASKQLYPLTLTPGSASGACRGAGCRAELDLLARLSERRAGR